MARTERWVSNWSPYITGTEIERLSVLATMNKALSQHYLTLDDNTGAVILIDKLAELRVLNRSQIGALIGLSRQKVAHLVEMNRIDIDDTHTVRGKLNPETLPILIEITTRLAGSDSVPESMMLDAMFGTEKGLINHLTGLPIHVMRGAVKSFEAKLRKSSAFVG